MRDSCSNVEELIGRREKSAVALTDSIRRAITCVARRDIQGVELCTSEQEDLYLQFRALHETLAAAKARGLSKANGRQLALAAMTYSKVLQRNQEWLKIFFNMLRLVSGDSPVTDKATHSYHC